MSRKALIRRIASSKVLPTSYLDYKPYLSSLFGAIKRDLGKYTYHQFAEDLGFAPTNIAHQFIRGHRKLSLKAAKTIVKSLELKGAERRYFEYMVDYCNVANPQKREELFQKMLQEKAQILSSEQDKAWLDYLSEWYHPVIRELVGLAGFQSDPQWISDQIQPRIRPEQAKKSLELLETLGFIRFDAESHQFRQTQKELSTGHEVRGIGFTRYHQKMIEMGRESLANIPARWRDISATTFSVDEQTFRKIKSLVHEFNARVLSEVRDCPNPDRIFQMNVQLFPFAHIDSLEREREQSKTDDNQS